MTGATLNGRNRRLSEIVVAGWYSHEAGWLLEFEYTLWREAKTIVQTGGEETRLYAIFDRDAVKLGVARKPAERLADLQTANPRELALYTSCAGNAGLERFFHRWLNEWRVRGEWFAVDSHVLAAVSLIASGNDHELDARSAANQDEDGLLTVGEIIDRMTWRIEEIQRLVAS